MPARNEYLENQILTASPKQLHLLVIDGAIRSARQAQRLITEQKFEAAHFALNKSRECVGELLAGLKPEQLPETIENLKALFLFIHRKLMLADLEHNVQNIVDALNILEQYRETWLLLMKEADQNEPTAPVSPPAPHFQTQGETSRSQPQSGGPHISMNRDSTHSWTT